jgi:hypothetical protein
LGSPVDWHQVAVPYPWLVGSMFVYLLLELDGQHEVHAGQKGEVVRMPHSAGLDLADRSLAPSMHHFLSPAR